MPLSEQQLLERRAYLGGTDAAALAGVNPPGWAQPIDVYLEKVGLGKPRATTTMMGMGNLMESVVAELFTEASGIRLRRASRTIRSRQYPWAGGHLDRWALDGSIFEAKWAMRKDGWGEGLGVGTLEAPVAIPGPDAPAPRIPPHYAVQVQHYLAVTGRQLAYVAVLLGYGDFRWYALWRDEAKIALLMQLEERFWIDNVLAGVPPQPDGSQSYGRHLRELYQADAGEEAIATPEQQAMVAGLQAARTGRDEYVRIMAGFEQQLQLSMGTTSKLIGPGFTVSWRATKPRLKVEWEELATELLRQISEEQAADWPKTKKDRAELVRRYARTLELAHEEPGSRPC